MAQDVRTWHRAPQAIYVRVPDERGYARTVAWARVAATDPQTWQVRVLEGPHAGLAVAATRAEAENRLDNATQGAS